MVIRSGGYKGKLLRVDLTSEEIWEEALDEDVVRKWVGGTGLGVKYLYEEVPPGVEWSDPENRLMFLAGPMSGTRVAGSGTYSVVTKGCMTNLAASSQANGFFGAFLKFSGYDGVIIQGKAKRWVYLYIHDNTAELREAIHLLGKDTWDTEDAIKEELGVQCSVHGIGPAGENLVRFACIVGDHGHVAAHNGVGAVMGSKKLKAIVAARGKQTIKVANPTRLGKLAPGLFENSRERTAAGMLPKVGTAGALELIYLAGRLPVKNYTTSIFPEYETLTGQYIRSHFEMIKQTPCWACRMSHLHLVRVTEGPFRGYVGEEPEYECMAMNSAIGQSEPGAAVVLSNMADKLGMDVNEIGWVLGWVMECYEKGLLTNDDLDGVEMNWGNVNAIALMMHRIAHRQGFGNILAEGVKRASEHIGGESVDCAIFTLKGAAPRGHDHRSNWDELIDTCLSNTGTVEATGSPPQPKQLGLTAVKNAFDPEEVSTMNAQLGGRRQFEDTLGVCRFCVYDIQLTIDALNAITGWDWTISDAITSGQRIINQLRVFNLRHGLNKEMEVPSPRYGSAPVDGPGQGISIMPHWEFIQQNYYKHMGWDSETGIPRAETLKRLGLENLAPDLKRL